MAGLKTLVSLAFFGACGLLLVVLACALPGYDDWWPIAVIATHILSPIPNLIGAKVDSDPFSSGDSEGAVVDICQFITSVIVVSGFAFPLVLAHAGTIQLGACILTLIGNVLVFGVILAYMYFFEEDTFDSWERWEQQMEPKKKRIGLQAFDAGASLNQGCCLVGGVVGGRIKEMDL
eukprot:Nk52_evm76s210 gene=Nk52_evmTU76s210